MKKFLMCFPKEFGVNYEINPWMNSNVGKVNRQQAINQWEELYLTLYSISEITVMEDQPAALPDLVFTANAALTINNHALISRFSCVERQSESCIYQENLLKMNLLVDDYFIKSGISFEGAGDALLEKQTNTLILGYGFRTEQKAYSYVSSWLNKISPKTKILQVQLINSSFYHLDTCLCPLDNGYVMYYPGAFSKKSQEDLNLIFKDKLIEIDKNSAQYFGCNAVSVESKLIVNILSVELERKLNAIGVEVIKTPLDQFLLAGGSAKCLTLELSLMV